ncbi:class I SAM-dependent methyltransferase [Fodinibius sp. AD559]|uniref:class I SAM-dependent methyltransferase n=1 Tax=Fodinibius sp. AD559 TaxID=3424179 RepID=UPI004046F784
MSNVDIFDKHTERYDEWFDEHPVLFESELEALDKVVPYNKYGLEVGIGTGRFAKACAIDRGIDPSENMARIAEQRGTKTLIAKAENMPFPSNTFGFVVMVTVVCFLDDMNQALSEIKRVLKPEGELIIGMIDKESPLGQQYQQEKAQNPFYKEAKFYSVDEITEILSEAGFGSFEYWQTLITASEEEPKEPQPGYGEGGFVAIKAVLN